MIWQLISSAAMFANRLKMKNTFNKCFMIPVKQNTDVEYKRSINCTFLIFQPMRNWIRVGGVSFDSRFPLLIRESDYVLIQLKKSHKE